MPIDIEKVLAAHREALEEEIAKRRQKMLDRQASLDLYHRESSARDEEILRNRVAFFNDLETNGPNPSTLNSWLAHDTWTVREGLILLCGFSPSNVPLDANGQLEILRLPGEDTGYFSEPEQQENIRALRRIRRLTGVQPYDEFSIQLLGKDYMCELIWDFKMLHGRLLTLWASGLHSEQRYPPKYFIDWAVSKSIDVPWLSWAKANGNYVADPTSEEKPLSTHERNTLLVLIAALCAKAGIDPKARGAAGQLVRLASVEAGVTLDDGTVLDKLKQIPDAVGARRR